MRYVFLSHASNDKPLLEPLVMRLLDRDLKLWIDTPGRISHDPRLKDMGRIPYGNSWREAVEQSVQNDQCIVLFVWSKNAATRFTSVDSPTRGSLQWELEIGLNAGRLFGVRLDATKLTVLDQRIKDHHFCKIGDYKGGYHSDLDDFLQDLDAAVHAVDPSVRMPVAGRKQSRKDIDPAAVFLANRDNQSGAFGDLVLDLAKQTAPATPLMVVGPKDERPDEFLERCWSEARAAMPKHAFQPHLIHWPRSGDFRKEYLKSLAREALGQARASEVLNAAEPAAALAQAMRAQARPRAFYSIASAIQWPDDQPQRIDQWLKLWSELDDASGAGLRALPLLNIRMEEAGRVWKDLPPTPAGQRVSNKQIWSALTGLCGEASRQSLLTPRMADILAPIEYDHAVEWTERLSRYSAAAYQQRKSRLDAVIDELFPRRRANPFAPLQREPKSMQTFAERMQQALNEN